MNKYLKYTFAALSFVTVATSCGDFGDTNLDPEHLNEGNVPYSMVFTNAQHQALGSDWDVWRNGVIYASQWNQHIACGGWYWDYGVNSFSDGYSSALWDGIYSGGRGAVRDVTTVMDLWKKQAGMEQNYNIARIMRVYTMHRLTDLYGDIPYSEAGRPLLHSYPKYDSQESIYMDMLKELDEAQANLTTGKAPVGSQDIYYGGDVAKWKKFANSMMLRLAMRLSKVAPDIAKTWVAKAVANGPIIAAEDNCYLLHSGGSVNDDSSEPYAKIFTQSDPGTAFINKTFYNVLSSTNDPRIPLIMCVVPDNPTAGFTNKAYSYGSSDPTKQKGLPGCYSMGPTSDYFIGKYFDEFYYEQKIVGKDTIELGNKELYKEAMPGYYKKIYSQPNRYTYADPEGPTFLATAAQTYLLMAEAAKRGWITGSAKTYYEQGVTAAMKQFAQFPNGNKLYSQYMSDAVIATYLTNNPYDDSKAFEQINTQYWITCFCDEYETFSNWRRSGFPTLTYPDLYLKPLEGVNHNLSRRFTYPINESQINSAHYKEAVDKLTKGDTFESRVWWDVAQ